MLLGALSAFPALSIDMYLPGLPQMTTDLATTPGTVQLTVTLFVVGLAAGQLLVGPLSDAWGRRPLLLAGLGCYALGSVACWAAPDARWLLVARVAQALGAAAATVLARAIVRDHVSGTAMTRLLAALMLVNGAATVVGPILGSQVLAAASWRAVFAVLAVVGVVLLVAVLVALPESLPAKRRRRAHPRATLAAYVRLGRDRSYLACTSAAALMFAAMFAYISASAFVLQDGYGLSAGQFSLVFAGNAAGIALLGQVNSLLVGRVADEETLLRGSLVLATLAGAGVLAAAAYHLPLPVLLVPLSVLVSLLGPVLANATSLALGPHPDDAGTASSLQGVLQYVVAGVVASLAGGLGGADVRSMTIAMGAAIFGSVAAALLVLGRRPRRRTPLERTDPSELEESQPLATAV